MAEANLIDNGTQAGSPTPADSYWKLFWRSLAGIVDQPQPTLAEIYARARGAWVGPLLLLVLSLIVITVAQTPFMAEVARRAIEALPADQAAQAAARMQQLSTPAFMAVTGSLSAIIRLAVSLLLSTAVVYFGGLVAGSELNFGPLFAVMIWAWLPLGLRNLVQAAVIAGTRHPIVNHGLSWLVSVGDQAKDSRNFLYFVLSYVEVFWLWHLVLVWAGVRRAGRTSAGKAALVVALYVAVTIGLAWIVQLVVRVFSPVGAL